jgi:hypothetical protein
MSARRRHAGKEKVTRLAPQFEGTNPASTGALPLARPSCHFPSYLSQLAIMPGPLPGRQSASQLPTPFTAICPHKRAMPRTDTRATHPNSRPRLHTSGYPGRADGLPPSRPHNCLRLAV